MMKVRLPVGTRLEDSAIKFAEIQESIRRIIPAEEIVTMVDNIGMPSSLTFSNTGVIGSQDGDIQIALSKDHQPTADHIKRLWEVLPKEFPGATFSFPPSDIVSQILNFGSPAPIDIQIRGNNLDGNFD